MVQSGWYALVCVIALEKPGPESSHSSYELENVRISVIISSKKRGNYNLMKVKATRIKWKIAGGGGNINESEVLKVSDGVKKYLEIFFLAIDAAEFTPNQSRSSLTKSTAR